MYHIAFDDDCIISTNSLYHAAQVIASVAGEADVWTLTADHGMPLHPAEQDALDQWLTLLENLKPEGTE
jgi:hypothetical protein